MFMRHSKFCTILLASLTAVGVNAQQQKPRNISGIIPSIAFFNNEGECGTGAVVPWAGSLWAVTYGPHSPFGDSNKLHQISADYTMKIFPGSVGGTHADRMIHLPSQQLVIGPYFIDKNGKVRVMNIKKAPGRYTGVTLSLKNPRKEVVMATMEQGFYTVNVNSLKTKTIFEDGNQLKKEGRTESYQRTLCKGVHGKGFYSGQGVYVYSNNGEDSPQALVNPRTESGSLSEFDGKTWKLVRRNQFTEITGPGGITGPKDSAHDPIWSLGFDSKSVVLALRDYRHGWSFYRLPKADNSYDGAHGWNTEWPRIRNVGTDSEPYYLMTMHGMFWHFPATFAYGSTGGLRPLTSYLKIIPDFTSWQGGLAFGCDDSAQSEFMNKRKFKGGIHGPGQSQSNIWFTSMSQPAHNGTSDAIGCVWEDDNVKAGEVSEPMLLAGWNTRNVWLQNKSSHAVTFTFEVDRTGNGKWAKAFTLNIPANGSLCQSLADISGEWIRVKASAATKATVAFVYADTRERSYDNAPMFSQLAPIGTQKEIGGLVYGLGDNRRKLGVVANAIDDGKTQNQGYYEVDGNVNIEKFNKPADSLDICQHMAIPTGLVSIDRGSYLLIDDNGRRWRLPLGDSRYSAGINSGKYRLCREVATERDLFNLGGTFYVLPAENAGGFEKLRPIATHNLQINDYGSYRGLLIMTGLKSDAQPDDGHVFRSEDGKCAFWAGAIDDLWKLGKPRGEGGPWVETSVKANTPSDAFLISHYDKKSLSLSHNSKSTVTFTVEMDPTGDGTWMTYARYQVKAGERFTTTLPQGHLARWIRFTVDADCKATTWLTYE